MPNCFWRRIRRQKHPRGRIKKIQSSSNISDYDSIKVSSSRLVYSEKRLVEIFRLVVFSSDKVSTNSQRNFAAFYLYVQLGGVAQWLERRSFNWRTFPGLRVIYDWHVTTSWVRLWVDQPGQLSLPSLRGRQMSSNPCNYMNYGGGDH